MVIDCPEDFCRDHIRRQASIHLEQAGLMLVILRHRPGRPLVSVQTLPNHFLTVIIADYQPGTVKVANFIHPGWLEMDVINVSVGETSSTSGEPEQQLIIVHINQDHNWPAPAG